MRLDQEDSSAFNTYLKSVKFSHSRRVLTTDFQITQNGSLVNALDPNGGTFNVRMPPFEAGRFYVVANDGDTGALNVVSFEGAAITTLAANNATLLFASDNVWTGVAGSMNLGVFGPVGPTHSTGLVPDPGPGSASSPHRYLAETGVWETVAGLSASNAYFYGHKGGAVTVLPVGSETLEFLSANTAITILGQSGTSPKSMLFTLNAANIDHNALLNYSANRHIDHTAVSVTAGTGLSGGGTIDANRSLAFTPSGLTTATPSSADYVVWDLAAGGPRRGLWSSVFGMIDHNALLNYSANRHIDHTAVSIVASTGLSGGGDLTTSRSLSLDINSLTTDTVASGDFVAFYDISGVDTNKATIGSLSPQIDHNALTNYVADQHVAHSSVSIATTEGVQGGGTIAATRTLKLDINGLTVDPSPVAGTDYLATYDASAGTHKKILINQLPSGGGGISEAPNDGQQYGRQSLGWTVVTGVTPAALTRVNDTNVTATLGGTPATALLQATSITLGWTGTLGLVRGGTAADLSATGGAGQYLKQVSSGAAVTVGTIPVTDLTSAAALTKVDDTNVTLTLGGTPATALLRATSLTLGWTGTLAVTRGGTGLATVAQGDLLYGSASNTLSALTKDTNSTRYLSNTGTTNNPAWAQINLANGVTGALPNANLGTMAAFTFKGNNSGSTAAPGDVDIAALTAKGVPVSTDLLLLSDQAASGAWKKITVASLPFIGDAVSDNDTWARENGTWKKIPTITVATSAPGSPAVGDVWIDTN